MFQVSIDSIQKHLSYCQKTKLDTALPTNVNLLAEIPAKNDIM